MNEQDVPQWLRAAFEEQARQIQELAAQNARTIATLAGRIEACEERARMPNLATNRMPSPPLPQQPPPEPVVRRPRPSLPNPDQFDGSNQALYPQFESKLKAKLEIDGRTIGGENEQVWYAFGRLSGEAAGRIHPWMVHAQHANTLGIEGFFKQIRLAFSDPRASQKALELINRTKQGSRLFNDFLNEFNRLILEAEGWGWDDKVKKAYLKAAISHKLKDRTIGMNEAESYEEYCSQLRMISDQLADLQDWSSRRAGWKKEGFISPPKEPTPEIMDWELSTATTATRTRRGPRWAPPEEIDRRREEGLCLRCGRKGHIVRHCRATLRTTKKDVKVAAAKRAGEIDVRGSDSEDSGKE
jgi:hypothetical protein